MTIPIRSTRYSDEELLRWIRLRCAGLSTTVIAETCSATGTYIRAATNRVVTADVAVSGDDVRRGYWA